MVEAAFGSNHKKNHKRQNGWGQELEHPNVEPVKDETVVRGYSAKNQCLASHQLLQNLLQFLQAFLVREGFESRRLIF